MKNFFFAWKVGRWYKVFPNNHWLKQSAQKCKTHFFLELYVLRTHLRIGSPLKEEQTHAEIGLIYFPFYPANGARNAK